MESARIKRRWNVLTRCRRGRWPWGASASATTPWGARAAAAANRRSPSSHLVSRGARGASAKKGRRALERKRRLRAWATFDLGSSSPASCTCTSATDARGRDWDALTRATFISELFGERKGAPKENGRKIYSKVQQKWAAASIYIHGPNLAEYLGLGRQNHLSWA